MTDVSQHPAASPHVDSTGQRGLWAMIFGGIVALLAPLAGFLGGSVVGSSAGESLDSMALWLVGGLAVGAVGGFVVCLGALRWFKDQRSQPAGGRGAG